MKAKFQVFTAKGFYGPQMETKPFKMLGEMADAVKNEVDYMPTELEGEQLVDWTSIRIEVVR